MFILSINLFNKNLNTSDTNRFNGNEKHRGIIRGKNQPNGLID